MNSTLGSVVPLAMFTVKFDSEKKSSCIFGSIFHASCLRKDDSVGYQHQLDDLYTRTSALIIQISNIQRTQKSSVLVHQLKRPFKSLTPPSGVFFQAQVIRVPTVICHLRSILLKELLVTFYSLLRDSMGPPLREKWYSGPQKSKPLHFHGLLDKIKTANMTDFRIISKKRPKIRKS